MKVMILILAHEHLIKTVFPLQVIAKLKSLPKELKRLRVTKVTTGVDQFGSFGAGVDKVDLPASTIRKTSSRTPDIVLLVKPGTPCLT